MAALLLAHGADPNTRLRSWGKTVDAAYFALGAGHVEMLEILLRHGADPEAALVSAAWQEVHAHAEAALRSGARPDRALHEGRPILNELVRWDQVEQALCCSRTAARSTSGTYGAERRAGASGPLSETAPGFIRPGSGISCTEEHRTMGGPYRHQGHGGIRTGNLCNRNRDVHAGTRREVVDGSCSRCRDAWLSPRGTADRESAVTP